MIKIGKKLFIYFNHILIIYLYILRILYLNHFLPRRNLQLFIYLNHFPHETNLQLFIYLNIFHIKKLLILQLNKY